MIFTVRLVKWDEDVARGLAADIGGDPRILRRSDFFRTFLIRTPDDANPSSVVQYLYADPRVEFADLQPPSDHHGLVAPASNDPMINVQNWDPMTISANWGLRRHSFFQAWRYTTGNPAVGVTVIDTGIIGHEDLTWPPANRRLNYWTDDTVIGDICGVFYTNRNTSHGTMTYSQIFATKGNGLGIAGGAPDCARGFVSCRDCTLEEAATLDYSVMESDNCFSPPLIYDGMLHAGQAWGHRIFQASIGGIYNYASFLSVDQALTASVQATNGFLCSSGGNTRNYHPGFTPTSQGQLNGIPYLFPPYQHMSGMVSIYGTCTDHGMCCGAIGPDDRRALMGPQHIPIIATENYPAMGSAWGPGVDICAAGLHVRLPHVPAGFTAPQYSDDAVPWTVPWPEFGQVSTGYEGATGTSMAAPFVSAAAALVVSVNPNLTNSQIRDILKSTSDRPRNNLPDPEHDIFAANGYTFGDTWDDVFPNAGILNAGRAVAKAMATVPANAGLAFPYFNAWGAGCTDSYPGDRLVMTLNGEVSIQLDAYSSDTVTSVELWVGSTLAYMGPPGTFTRKASYVSGQGRPVRIVVNTTGGSTSETLDGVQVSALAAHFTASLDPVTPSSVKTLSGSIDPGTTITVREG